MTAALRSATSAILRGRLKLDWRRNLSGCAARPPCQVNPVFAELNRFVRRAGGYFVADAVSVVLAYYVQVPVINAAFTPSAAEIARATAIVSLFREHAGAGVISLDGQMLDRPHLVKAERVLARASAAGVA